MHDSESRAVASAEGVALFRAFGAFEPRAAFRNPDHLACRFLGPKSLRSLRFMKRFRRLVKWQSERRMPGSYWYLFVRTRRLDRLVLEAASEGIRQLVILGAGYDSRVLRFREQLEGIRCFEVDLPATQAAKRMHLDRMEIEEPTHLTFVPIDFNTQDLAQVLPARGYNEDEKTLFLWEGVCLYLPEASIDTVLEFVRDHSGQGSSIAFDYITEAVARGRDLSALGAAETHAGTEGLGEPILFGLDPADTRDFLSKRGFDLESDLSSSDLADAYLTTEKGGHVGRLLGFTQIALARVRRGPDAALRGSGP